MTTKAKWVIERSIFSAESHSGFVESLIRNGNSVAFTDYVPFSKKQDYGEWGISEPVVLYGSVGWLKCCDKVLFPGAFGFNENMNCHIYYSYIPKEWMLNGQYIMTTLKSFKENSSKFFEIFGNALFIRPNSGFKSFTGLVVFEDTLTDQLQSTAVNDHELILVAPAVNIHAEYRFIVGNGDIITGSEYRRDNKLSVRDYVSPKALELAQKMAKHTWQPDLIYSVDVAITEDGPKIIELNSFSCCGFYACDTDKIAKQVSELSEKYFDGEI